MNNIVVVSSILSLLTLLLLNNIESVFRVQNSSFKYNT